MLNILLQAIYYAQDFAQNLAILNSDIMHNITSCRCFYKIINCADRLTVLLEYIDLLCSVAKHNE